jgi:hypothetical protein
MEIVLLLLVRFCLQRGVYGRYCYGVAGMSVSATRCAASSLKRALQRDAHLCVVAAAEWFLMYNLVAKNTKNSAR